jgi:nitroreductase
MNSVLTTIHIRRSIRKYLPEQIGDDDLSAILEAGRAAPSGGNNQTSHFIVIQNANVLRELKQLVSQEFGKMDVSEGVYKSLRGSIMASKNGGYDFIYNSPTFVIAANQKDYGNSIADCSCALENMMLAASSLNIGTCWINQLHWLDNNEEIRMYLQNLGLDATETICGGLAIGYPAAHDLAQIDRTGNKITYIK